MVMRLPMAFDHIPAAVDSGTNYNTYSDYPPIAVGTNGGLSWGIASDSGYNWLNFSIAGANGYGYWSMLGWLVSSLFDITKPRSFCGFRVKPLIYNSPLNAANLLCWQVGGAMPSNGPNGSTMAILKTTDYAWPLNQDFYVEIMFDWMNLTRTVWIDGLKIISAQALGFTPSATDRLGFAISSNGAANNPYIRVKDMYFLDDSGDGAIDSQRLGPQVFLPLTMNDASGNGWTSSDGAGLLADINTAITGSANLAAPYAQSPGDGTPLDMHFSTSGLSVNNAIKGLMVLGSATRPGGTLATVKTVVTDQATPTPNIKRLADQTFTGPSVVPNRSLGYLAGALDGTAWTPSKIQQLKVSMNAIQPGT